MTGLPKRERGDERRMRDHTTTNDAEADGASASAEEASPTEDGGPVTADAESAVPTGDDAQGLDPADADAQRRAAATPDVDEAQRPDSDGPRPDEADPADDPDPDDPAETQRLRSERDQWRDRHLRLAADFDNYRKRSDEQMRARWNRAQADLASRLLDPLDDLLRISELDHETGANVEAVVEGAGLVERKFLRLLEEVGVQVVNPVGELFDPNTMEAMMRVPTESEDDDDMVERVFQKGYVLKGQLLRPARVSVYKAG